MVDMYFKERIAMFKIIMESYIPFETYKVKDAKKKYEEFLQRNTKNLRDYNTTNKGKYRDMALNIQPSVYDLPVEEEQKDISRGIDAVRKILRDAFKYNRNDTEKIIRLLQQEPDGLLIFESLSSAFDKQLKLRKTPPEIFVALFREFRDRAREELAGVRIPEPAEEVKGPEFVYNPSRQRAIADFGVVPPPDIIPMGYPVAYPSRVPRGLVYAPYSFQESVFQPGELYPEGRRSQYTEEKQYRESKDDDDVKDVREFAGYSQPIRQALNIPLTLSSQPSQPELEGREIPQPPRAPPINKKTKYTKPSIRPGQATRKIAPETLRQFTINDPSYVPEPQVVIRGAIQRLLPPPSASSEVFAPVQGISSVSDEVAGQFRTPPPMFATRRENVDLGDIARAEMAREDEQKGFTPEQKEQQRAREFQYYETDPIKSKNINIEMPVRNLSTTYWSKVQLDNVRNMEELKRITKVKGIRVASKAKREDIIKLILADQVNQGQQEPQGFGLGSIPQSRVRRPVGHRIKLLQAQIAGGNNNPRVRKELERYKNN